MGRKAASVKECIADVLTSVEEKREKTSLVMKSHYEGTSHWLEEAFQSCKRKILEGTTNSDAQHKKTKTGFLDKENGNPNKLPVAEAPREIVPGLTIKKEIMVENSGKKKDPISELNVKTMKVTELKRELSLRGLATSGLKKNLQNRLLESINAQRETEDVQPSHPKATHKVQSMINPSENGVASSLPPTTQQRSEIVDADMEDVSGSEKGVLSSDQTKTAMEKEAFDAKSSECLTKASISSAKDGSSCLKLTRDGDADTKAGQECRGVPEEKFPSNGTVTILPLKQEYSQNLHYSEHAPVPSNSQVKVSDSKADSCSMEKKTAIIAPSLDPLGSVRSPAVQKDTILNKKMKALDMSKKEGQSRGVQEMMRHDPTAASKSSSLPKKGESVLKASGAMVTPAVSLIKKVDKSTGGSSTATSGGSSSVSTGAKAKHQALADARKARLAEMRGKSKPIVLEKSKHALKDMPSVSKLVLKTSRPGVGNDEKRKQLAAQMREKAAASKKKKGDAMPQNKQAQTLSKTPAMPLTSTHHQGKHQKKPQPVATVPKVSQKNSHREEMRSPMDTYEISDREESDSESDYEEDSKPRKKIPKWAEKANLLKALQKQYIGEGRLDPDTIFPEVQTCDLEAIFDRKKSRYKQRTSSGNWTKDRVTAVEKLTYKRKMGYADA